jgi:general secretion pathway protein M
MPLDAIKERFSNLTDRERILVIAFASVFCVTIAAVSFALVKKKTGDLKSTIEENTAILAELKENREELSDKIRLKEQEEARFENPAPPLLGLLEKLGGEAGIDIPESRDLPDEIIGKKWTHKSVEIRLRKIGLDSLVHFMVKIKNENRSYPLAVTKMNIKKRAGEPNSYDIQMTVSTYSKKGSTKKKASQKDEDKKTTKVKAKEVPPTPMPTEFTAEQ